MAPASDDVGGVTWVGFSHFGSARVNWTVAGTKRRRVRGTFRRSGNFETSRRFRKLTSSLRRRRERRGRSRPSPEARERKGFVSVLRVGLRISYSILSGRDSSRLPSGDRRGGERGLMFICFRCESSISFSPLESGRDAQRKVLWRAGRVVRFGNSRLLRQKRKRRGRSRPSL